jgi:hypothetical protein
MGDPERRERQMTRSIKKAWTVTALVIVLAAISVPTAGARPVEEYLPGTSQGQSEPGTPEPAPAPTPSATVDGFDWGDAGIGASAVLALGAIATGTLVATGHGPRRRQTVA